MLTHLLDTCVFDLLISATALTHDLTIATLNTRHFLGIEGLHVEDWSILH